MTNRNRQTDVLAEHIPDILERTRDLRDLFVDLILANSTDNMTEGQQLISGYPIFVGPDRLQITDPDICAVGAKFDAIDDPTIGEQCFGPNGRALAMDSNRGPIRIYADTNTVRVLGASMVGPRVEHLAHLVAWAIQMGLTITDMSKMPFYHPVVEEALQEAQHDTSKKLQRARVEAEERIGRMAS